MQEAFFTSKQSATGTGRSVYYSKANLLELAVMVHFLSVGLSFDLASEALKTLEDKEPELFTTSQSQGKRFMLLGSPKNKLSKEGKITAFFLMEFDREKAIASLDKAKLVITVWLDQYQQRSANIKSLNKLREHTWLNVVVTSPYKTGLPDAACSIRGV